MKLGVDVKLVQSVNMYAKALAPTFDAVSCMTGGVDKSSQKPNI